MTHIAIQWFCCDDLISRDDRWLVWCPGSCGHILNVWDLLDLFRSEFLIFDLPPEKEFCITLFRKLHQIEAKQAKKIYGGISPFIWQNSVLSLDLNLKRSSLWRKMHFHWNFPGVGKLKCCWPDYQSKFFWHKSQKSLKILWLCCAQCETRFLIK